MFHLVVKILLLYRCSIHQLFIYLFFFCSPDENLREELHAMLVPDALKISWNNLDNDINLFFYYIRFVPIPEDRQYRMFGLFVKAPLPKEAEALEVDLHLARGRIVKTGFEPLGMLTFNKEEVKNLDLVNNLILIYILLHM